MTQNYTTDDLIRLMYCECGEEEAADIAYELESSQKLNFTFLELQRIYKALSRISLKPSEKSVQRILKFSRDSTLETQH